MFSSELKVGRRRRYLTGARAVAGEVANEVGGHVALVPGVKESDPWTAKDVTSG